MANTNWMIMARSSLTAIPLALVCLNLQAQDNEAAWKRTVQSVIPSVVTLRVSKVRSFDTETNALLDGTGFVVDAERGIMLTNRHVVSTGPVRVEAVFSNQEEIEVERIYADPVHDFGFLRYDPDDLRAARPSAIPLSPEAAEVGKSIRVVGNDAGNRISILDGTIARLDHTAPTYGDGSYNDFNTFYLQAASGTSGGSSGSPVIDLEGRAVALNASARTKAATSYFLPLDRVRHALELIRAGEAVPRGSLLTTFEQMPFAELRRLGLTEGSEASARSAAPERSGLLVVRSTVRESPASAELRPGDILLRIEGVALPDFVQLEEVLDAFVGWTVDLAVERQGVFWSFPLRSLICITSRRRNTSPWARRSCIRFRISRREISMFRSMPYTSPTMAICWAWPKLRLPPSCVKSMDARFTIWTIWRKRWRGCVTEI